MPNFIAEIHRMYIDNFLTSGDSRFYENVEITFAKFKNGFIHPIEMFYTINPLFRLNLEFIAFF